MFAYYTLHYSALGSAYISKYDYTECKEINAIMLVYPATITIIILPVYVGCRHLFGWRE